MAFREKAQPVIGLERGVGIGGGWDGVVKKNLHTQYIHIHPHTYSVLRGYAYLRSGGPARGTQAS